MQIEDAVKAGQLAADIMRVQQLLTSIDIAIAEMWPVSALRVAAPTEGASQPAGTELDLLASGADAGAELWKIALSTARDGHQAKLAELTKQLEAM